MDDAAHGLLVEQQPISVAALEMPTDCNHFLLQHHHHYHHQQQRPDAINSVFTDITTESLQQRQGSQHQQDQQQYHQIQDNVFYGPEQGDFLQRLMHAVDGVDAQEAGMTMFAGNSNIPGGDLGNHTLHNQNLWNMPGLLSGSTEWMHAPGPGPYMDHTEESGTYQNDSALFVSGEGNSAEDKAARNANSWPGSSRSRMAQSSSNSMQAKRGKGRAVGSRGPRGEKKKATDATDGGKFSTSKYRGVTRHKRSGRWEAHIWIKDLKKQIYLGGYELEDSAAEAYDVAALKSKGCKAQINFPLEKYQDLVSGMDALAPEELWMAVRRQSQGHARGSSTYRGVTSHPSGRWESRIGVPGSRHVYLGLFEEEIEAARSYDRSLVRLRGTNAATNFALNDYGKEMEEHCQAVAMSQHAAKALEDILSGKDYEHWVKYGSCCVPSAEEVAAGIASLSDLLAWHPQGGYPAAATTAASNMDIAIPGLLSDASSFATATPSPADMQAADMQAAAAVQQIMQEIMPEAQQLQHSSAPCSAPAQPPNMPSLAGGDAGVAAATAASHSSNHAAPPPSPAPFCAFEQLLQVLA